MPDASISIGPMDMTSLLFKVKKFEFNNYKIEHPKVKGFLRVGNIPNNILKISDEKFVNMPAGMNILENMKYIISYQGIVGFVNRGEKKKPTEPWLPQYVNSKTKQDLFGYIINEQTYEPWNEFVIQGKSPVLIRTKTTLTNAYLYVDCYNNSGDPIIRALHNTSISISSDSNAEVGMI